MIVLAEWFCDVKCDAMSGARLYYNLGIYGEQGKAMKAEHLRKVVQHLSKISATRADALDLEVQVSHCVSSIKLC